MSGATGEDGGRLGGPSYGWRRGWPLPTLASRPAGDAVIVTTSPPGRLAELPERVGGPGDDPLLTRRAARALGLRSAIPGGPVLDPSADAG